MPQTQRLSTPFVGPAGVPSAAPANTQGELIAASRPGSTWYVDETNGDDDANGAGSPYRPMATITAAVAVAVAGDTIYITGTVHISDTLVIAQSNLAIVGLNAPSSNNRARISQTGSTVFTPLVSVTGQGNRFENFGTFHGFANASTQICWSDTGGRNYYKNVDLFGMGNLTAAAQTGSRSLLISGTDGEHLFEGCRIGLDTVLRATGLNASLEIAGGSPRNIFRNCIFAANCSNAADVHVLIGSGGMDRWALFDNCTLANYTGGGGTSLTADFSVHASAGGFVMVQGGMSIGAGKISAAGPVLVNGAVPTAGTSSLGVTAS